MRLLVSSRLLYRLNVLTVNFRSEILLRRALFEETGGMYPELITRPDIKVFLPPIGNLTVYICKVDLFFPVFSLHRD